MRESRIRMDEPRRPPDPTMRIVVVASLSPQEAALLAGRLQADGIRAMTAPSQTAPGPWTAVFGFDAAPLGLAANPMQRRTTDVLVEERDAAKARKIADRYLRP